MIWLYFASIPSMRNFLLKASTGQVIVFMLIFMLQPSIINSRDAKTDGSVSLYLV
jgi:hypothetical protein